MPPRAKGHRKVDANIAAGCRAVFCRIGEVILHVKRWGFIAVRLPLWREPETFDWIFHEKFLIQGLHGLLDERKGDGKEDRDAGRATVAGAHRRTQPANNPSVHVARFDGR